MSVLTEIIVHTGNMDDMRAFYETGIGLRALRAGPQGARFETGGAALALHPLRDGAEREVEVAFESAVAEAEALRLRERGIDVGDVRSDGQGRRIRFRDHEGNPLSLRQGGGMTSAGAGDAPALASVIVNCRDLVSALAFYRDRLGLKVAYEAPHWVELDTGPSRLALHMRPSGGDHPLHAVQGVAYCLDTPDLDTWVEEMRARGVHFATAPIEEEFGLYAEAVDPDGNVVVFRQPGPAPSIEEELAEAFESDEVPHVVAIRKPILKGGKAVSRVALRPEYHETAPPRTRAAREIPEPHPGMASVRGAGPDHARLRPKTTGDTKRAKAKPAIGRSKKAARTSVVRQRSAAASASKSRPVKRAAPRPKRGKRG